MANDTARAAFQLPACRELLDSHPGSLRIREQVLSPPALCRWLAGLATNRTCPPNPIPPVVSAAYGGGDDGKTRGGAVCRGSLQTNEPPAQGRWGKAKGVGVLLPACRELLDSHPGSLHIRRRFPVPEGRQLIAWGASPRDRAGDETKAPEGRNPARRYAVSPLRGCKIRWATVSWGSRPRLLTVAAPRLMGATSKLARRTKTNPLPGLRARPLPKGEVARWLPLLL